jgi:hypothetical protein
MNGVVMAHSPKATQIPTSAIYIWERPLATPSEKRTMPHTSSAFDPRPAGLRNDACDTMTNTTAATKSIVSSIVSQFWVLGGRCDYI